MATNPPLIPDYMVALIRDQYNRMLGTGPGNNGYPTADLYRPGKADRLLPPTPTLRALPVSVEPLSRLSVPENIPAGDQAQIPVRVSLQFAYGTDVRERDVIVVGPDRYVVEGVHTRTTYGVFTFADCVKAA